MRPTLLLLTLFASCHAWAGPFGIEMGDKPGDAKFSEFKPDDRPSRLFATSAPKPHPSIAGYWIWFSEKSGACFVKAVADTGSNDDYGSKVSGTADKLARQISSKYGEPEKTDELYGTRHDEADEWLYALYAGDRFYSYRWDATNDPSIASIWVGARAARFDHGYVSVEFKFTNFADCEAEEDAAGADAF